MEGKETMSHESQDKRSHDPASGRARAPRVHAENRTITDRGTVDAASSAGWPQSTRREVILGLAGGLLGCTLPGFAAENAQQPRTALADVPELEKRVTYCETKIPLGEFVAKVAADTGVLLTAARDVADEPVAVVVTDFPARELLEQLADLLDYRWSRRQKSERGRERESEGRGERDGTSPGLTPKAQRPTPVFEIWQDLASKRREEALRQTLLAAAEQSFQDQLAICRELAGKSDEEMRRLWDDVVPRYERLVKLPKDEQWAQAHTPQGFRDGYIRTLWSPIIRSLAGFASRLSPEQWTALRSGRPLVSSSSPKRGELPLPSEVLRVFRTARHSLSPPDRALYPTAPEFEEKLRQGAREWQEGWAQAEGYQVSFRFVPESPGWLAFLAKVAPLRGGKPGGEINQNAGFHILSHAEQFLPTSGDDPQRRARLEQDPFLSAQKPYTLDPRPFQDPLFPGNTRSIRLLPDLLPDLARTYGVNFIADSYWPVVLIPNPPLAGPAPLFQVLDRLCGNRYTWDRRGTLIRCRNRSWYQQRPSEIPLRLVRRWAALCDERGALPLEEYAALAATLTDRQLDTLRNLRQGGVFQTVLRDVADAADARYLLRLYSRLPAVQQKALREGKPLGIAQFPPSLRPLILATLRRAPLRRSYPLLGLDQWSAGHLAFTGEPDVRLREQRGLAVSYRLESAPAPPATATLAVVTRLPVARLKLEIDFGGEVPVSVPLVVAAESLAP
jgi:hypothetical protein